MNRPFLLLLGSFLSLGTADLWAAKAPLSPEKLNKQASHILRGTVVEVTSQDQKSTIEKSLGSHVDRVFTIKLRVSTITKGSGVKVGDEIEIEAWKPVRRFPPVPGLQGHVTIPEKGDTVTVYVESRTGKAYKPLLPNGMTIEK